MLRAGDPGVENTWPRFYWRKQTDIEKMYKVCLRFACRREWRNDGSKTGQRADLYWAAVTMESSANSMRNSELDGPSELSQMRQEDWPLPCSQALECGPLPARVWALGRVSSSSWRQLPERTAVILPLQPILASGSWRSKRSCLERGSGCHSTACTQTTHEDA